MEVGGGEEKERKGEREEDEIHTALPGYLLLVPARPFPSMSPSLAIQPGTKGSRILGTNWVFWGY